MLLWFIATVLSRILAIDPTPHPQAGSTWCDGCGDNNFCLPYDDSEVPDCSLYINPDHYLPYNHQHSSNCSRFWECGPAPAFEACLLECSSCCGAQPPEECPGACQDWDGQFYQANFFDERFNYWPEGPTCLWPIVYEGNCTMGGNNLWNIHILPRRDTKNMYFLPPRDIHPIPIYSIQS